MLRYVIPAAVTLCLCLSAAAAPVMTLSETSFEFGYAPQNSKISHVFWLKSVGDDSLKILQVKPGCGCTKAPLEKSILAPGDSTRLEVIFSTRSYRSRISKNPSIITNEESKPTHVRISSTVMTRPDSTYPIVIRPYKLDLSQFTDKRRDRIEFAITNVSDKDLELTVIDTPEAFFEINLPSSVKAGASATATLTLLPRGEESSFEKSITIEVGDSDHTRFTIPVKRTLRVPQAQQTAGAEITARP